MKHFSTHGIFSLEVDEGRYPASIRICEEDGCLWFGEHQLKELEEAVAEARRLMNEKEKRAQDDPKTKQILSTLSRVR